MAVSEPERPPSDDDLLRQWEERIADAGDPLGALADVLGGRREQRAELFRQAGRVVLGCTLESILGAGGAGVTYLARDAAGKPCAVKLTCGVTVAGVERFTQECRLLQSFGHAAIVRHHAHGLLPDATGVLVMEFVEGVDLDRLLEEVPFAEPTQPPWSELLHEVDAVGAERLRSERYRRRILRLLATVAEGLHEAHRQGIVHRDVKPANILVRADLSPVLIDFGLARDQQVRVSLTASGVALGTLGYMAPEQLGRDPGAVDARTDVYALGLVLFRALLGRNLRPDVAAVVRAAKRPFLLDRDAARELPRHLQAVLYRCLDPRPAQRYATAAALAEDLRAAAANGVVRAKRPSGVARFLRDRRRQAGALATLLVVAAALLVWLWPRGRLVVFSANVPPEVAHVDILGRESTFLDNPVWLPFGEHTVTLRSASVTNRLEPRTESFEVQPGVGTQRVQFLTYDHALAVPSLVASGMAIVQFMTGHAQSAMAPGVPLDQRFLDGVLLEDWAAYTRRGVLRPGRYVLRAVDCRGRVEEQVLDLPEGVSDVQLLPSWMASIEGDFRRTWSTVLSPRADDVEVTGDAIEWLGTARPAVIGGVGVCEAACAYVAGAPGRDATVRLRVVFPAEMRSAVVRLRGLVLPGAELEVDAGFEGERAERWPHVAGELQPFCAFRSSSGARAFVVQARMRCRIAPITGRTQVRFLDGVVFGPHWRDQPPCFAIVADPGDRAQLPSPSAGALVLTAAAAVAVEPIANDVAAAAVRALAFVAGPGGAHELWVAVRSEPQIGRIERLSWPGGRRLGELPAASLHDRRSVRDGEEVGAALLPIADQDGDGWQEMVVGDPTSARFGSANGGVVACLDSATRRPRWSWPSAALNEEHGDDLAWRVLPAGDWNGDGRGDVFVSAENAPGPDGTRRAGRLAVLDAVTGAEIWQAGGRGPRSHAQAEAAVDAAGGPAGLLWREHVNRAENDEPGDVRWVARLGGASGTTVEGPATARASVAVLLGSRSTEPPVSLLVFRTGTFGDGFRGLERFAPLGDRWGLVERRAVAAPGAIVDAGAKGSRDVWRCDDLDEDGCDDAAVLMRTGPSPHVLFVSGRTLEGLGRAELPGVGLHEPVVATWAPREASLPPRLVLAWADTIAGELRLATIRPPLRR